MKKKVLFIFVLLLMPLLVFADDDTCSENTIVKINSGDSVTCDNTKTTTAKFDGSANTYEALKNDVCTITCYENLVVSFNPVVKVLAGMGFRYPLYVSGERTCKATYNYQYYEDNMLKYVEDPTTYKAQLSNLYQAKNECDNFALSAAEAYTGSEKEDLVKKAEANKYKINADEIKLYLNDSEYTAFEWQDIGTDSYNSVVNTEKEIYTSCEFNGNVSAPECEGSLSTIKEWTETVKIFGKYTMAKKAYVEKYTGNVYYEEGETIGKNVCPAKDKYYTNLETESKYGVNADGSNNGYNIKLTVTGLGKNAKFAGWQFNVNCLYQVDNLIYPTSTTDPNNAKYGSSAFQYRIVDLETPFPGRDAYANWYGHETIITDTASNISMMNRWQINLTRSSINTIKENNNGNYSVFDLDSNEHSQFIEDMKSSIKDNREE